MNNLDKYLWGLLAFILVGNIPLFLSMPLTADAVLYDLQARCLLEGGILYRDILEPNLPGIIWCHVIIRSMGGWSTSLLRTVDLSLVCCSTMLLAFWVAGTTRNKTTSRFLYALTTLGILGFYLSTSEWCHCQRDTWMLAPALLGVYFFTHTLQRNIQQEFKQLRSFYLNYLTCGLIFGLAFWLKPFIALPILFFLAATKLYIPRWFHFSQIMLTIVSGGLLAGILGICWMINSGCWNYFLDTLTTWNPEYYQSGRSRWTMERYLSHASRFLPWILLHIPAVLFSLKTLWISGFKNPKDNQEEVCKICMDIKTTLIAAFYLGWLVQSFAFQQLFDYIHVPGLILGIAITCRMLGHYLNQLSQQQENFKLQYAALTFICYAVICSPLWRMERLQLWQTCLMEQFSVGPDVKNDLCSWPLPDWKALSKVQEFLENQKVRDGEVTAYNGSLIQIYPLLEMHSPHRFVYLDVHARCFPKHRQEMVYALDHSQTRYIVCDLIEDGVDPAWIKQQRSLLELQQELKAVNQHFPYNQSLVYQSERYLVYQKTSSAVSLSADYQPLGLQNRTISDSSKSHLAEK